MPKGFILMAELKILYNSVNKPRSLYFSRARFEGLIFGRAYVWRDLSTEGKKVSKSIGLA